MRQAMSRIAMPSAWKLVQMAARGPQRSSVQAIISCGVASSNSTASWPASNSSSRSRRSAPNRGSSIGISSRLDRLQGGAGSQPDLAQLLVAVTGEKVLDSLFVLPSFEIGPEQPLDHPVDLRPGDAPQHRPADRRAAREAAAQEDVVAVQPLP